MPLSSTPAWLQAIQDNARQVIEKSGWPSSKDEGWQYTPTKKILEKFKTTANENNVGFELPQELLQVVQSADSALVFYNGSFLQKYSKECSKADAHVQRLGQVLISAGRMSEIAKKSFERAPSTNLKGLGYENIAAFNDGSFVYIGAKAQQGQKILLLNLYGNQMQVETQMPFACHSRHVLSFGADVQAQVIEAHIAVNEIQFSIGHSTQVTADPASSVDYTQLWWLGEEARFVSDNYFSLQSESKLNLAQAVMGSDVGRLESLVELRGKSSALNLQSLVLGRGTSHTDYSSSVRHLVGETTSRQVARGVYDSSSVGVFSGHLHIDRDAQKSDAAQLTKNILIGESAQAYAKPQLEVLADDVKAAHGASVGQLREEEIFYLMSRGIRRDSAIRLLSSGIQRDVLRMQGEWAKKTILPFLNPDEEPIEGDAV